MTFRRHTSLAPLGREFLKRTLFFLTLTVLRSSGWVFCRLTLISAYLGFSRGKKLTSGVWGRKGTEVRTLLVAVGPEGSPQPWCWPHQPCGMGQGSPGERALLSSQCP